jgi:hypothetical protein
MEITGWTDKQIGRFGESRIDRKTVGQIGRYGDSRMDR